MKPLGPPPAVIPPSHDPHYRSREPGSPLAEAFSLRRARHPFNVNVWLGSDGLVGFLAEFVLAVALLASTAAVIVGLLMTITGATFTIVTAFSTQRIEGLPFLGIGSSLLFAPILLLRALTWFVGKIPRRQMTGMPFWCHEVFQAGTPWKEAARELFLSGQSGEGIVGVMLTERALFTARRSFVCNGLALLIVMACLAVDSLEAAAVFALAAMPALALVLGVQQMRNWELLTLECLYRFDSPGKGARVVAQASSLTASLLGFGIALFIVGMFLGVTSGIVFGFGGRSMQIVYTVAFGLVGGVWLIHQIVNLSRERHAGYVSPTGVSRTTINAVYNRYVMEELMGEQVDGPRTTLPARAQWSYPWELLADIAMGRGAAFTQTRL